MSTDLRAAIGAMVQRWGSEAALRCMALAYRTLPAGSAPLTHADESALTFVGLVGLHDPPRPEAADAVTSCGNAGIRVVMLTGARAPCRRMQLPILPYGTDTPRLYHSAPLCRSARGSGQGAAWLRGDATSAHATQQHALAQDMSRDTLLEIVSIGNQMRTVEAVCGIFFLQLRDAGLYRHTRVLGSRGKPCVMSAQLRER